MPFGLGFGEIILMLAVLGILGAFVLLVALVVSKLVRAGRSAPDGENSRLAAELEQARLRIEELEVRVARGERRAGPPQDRGGRP